MLQDYFFISNENLSKFVTAGKVCSKDTMPGGDGHVSKIPIGNVGGIFRVLLMCKSSDTFSKNMTTPSTVFTCQNGVWEDIPDCVPQVAKTELVCPSGHNTIFLQIFQKHVCGKCSKSLLKCRRLHICYLSKAYQEVF